MSGLVSFFTKQSRMVWSLAALAGDGATLVTWVTGAGMEILSEFSYPILTFVGIFCTGGLIVVNWEWINRVRPSVRFMELADEIELVLLETPEDRFHTTGPTMLENRVLLARKLNRLKIETPPNPGYGVYWRSYLEKLHLYAKLGNIDAARKLWAKEQKPSMNWEWWKE